jgi:methylphosphotriester-DNA--protein-cysteine methyltransferase
VPAPPLSDHVALFWAFDAYGGPHERERVLPTGTSELVITLGNERTCPMVLSGTQSRAFVIDVAARPTLLGVHFKPGGAVSFLGMPASEIADTVAPLDVLWGRAAAELKERLLEAATWEARFAVLESALRAKLGRARRRHRAVAFALQAIDAAPHVQTIGRLTECVGLSSRRFIELFAGEVGLTPKLYCRVQRFQRVLARIERHEAVDWSDVALACGYYDQAHFIGDFRTFAGISPTAYLRLRGPQRNHVPLGA